MVQKEYIQVWDLTVRIIHWSLPILGLVVLFSGDEESSVHFYTGGIILAIILFRILWGFVGSKYARFSNFIYSPIEVIRYLNGLIKGSPKRYIGHNPAAGWMMLLLLTLTLFVCVNGIMAYLDEGENDFWKDLHITSVYLLLTFTLIHILTAVVSIKLHKENLVYSMITGKKESD
jgi:cytochrome b